MVVDLRMLRACACAKVTVEYQDATGNAIRTADFDVPGLGNATIAGLVTAIETSRVNETGTAIRRLNYRVLGYLVDSGYLTGVTLAP